MKLHTKSGRLIDPANGIDAQRDLYIVASEVVGVGHVPADLHTNKTINVTSLVACPGLIDLPTRLREPGFEYRATPESEMAAATAGGAISLVCPPDTDPVLDEPGSVEALKFCMRSLNQAHAYPLGALTIGLKGAVLTEMAELTEFGCVGFSWTDTPMAGIQALMCALQYAQTFGFTIRLHPEDPYLGEGGVVVNGPLVSCLSFSGVPVITETVRLHTVFRSTRNTGVRVHLCRLSSTAGIELVCCAKARGLPVACDMNAHYISLADIDINYLNSQMRFVPPPCSGRDRDGTVRMLADGTIDVIRSDHTPVDDDEKLLPFAEIMPDATDLETPLPPMLCWATEHKIELSRALARIISEPARVLDLRVGPLEVGAMADVCVFNPEAT